MKFNFIPPPIWEYVANKPANDPSQSAGTTPEQVQTPGVAAVAAGSVRATIEQKLRYASEGAALMSDAKNALRGAQHYIGRNEFHYAQLELERAEEAARTLRTHLTRWGDWLKAERGPNDRDVPTSGTNGEPK